MLYVRGGIGVVLTGGDGYTIKHALSNDGAKVAFLLASGVLGYVVSRSLNVLAERAETSALKLQESERRFIGITANLPGVVFQLGWNADGNVGIRYVSESAERVFGVGNEWDESDFQQLAESIVTTDLALIRRRLRKAFVERESWSTEFRLTTRDRQMRWFRLMVTPDQLPNGEWVLNGLALDVHEQKAAEHALTRAKERAESADQAKTQFIANISHELRTPLNSVIGMTDLLSDSELRGEQTEFVEVIRSSADSLLSIINDILDFSKLKAGKLTPVGERFSPESVVASVVEPLMPEAGSKELDLIVSMAANVPAAVHGDAGRIRQVLFNLAGNAVKFTHSGHVAVETRAMPVGDQRVSLEFTVLDTGIGISRDHLHTIFDKFTQADASLTRRYSGTGLGLTISRELAEMLGGSIRVYSEPGRGSRFCFTVPVTVLEPSMVPTWRAAFRGCHVVLVDTHEYRRTTFVGFLEEHGLSVTSLANRDEARREIRRLKKTGRVIDLIICFCSGNAHEWRRFVAELRSETLLDDTPIAAFHSFRHHDGMERPEAAWCDASLPCPAPRTRILRVIQQLITSPEAGVQQSQRRAAVPAERFDARVLVVEDNAVNRNVQGRMLTRLGCVVDYATDGADALRHVRLHAYDLIIMDCQMPIIDGLETTRIIRTMEREAGGHTPIVALTGHAMPGDRDRFLAAGMDDYLSKPVRAADLAGVLRRWTRTVDTADRATDGVLDIARVMSMIGSDHATLASIINTFREDAPRRLRSLRASLKTQEWDEVRHAAHSLKGAAAAIAADRMTATAAELEQSAGSDPSYAEALASQLDEEYRVVLRAIQRLETHRLHSESRRS
jgi:signal transduction histidine kinase/DNA-binding response OmpR family regulator